VFHNPAGRAPAEAQQQKIQLLKSVSIVGGMLGSFAFGAGGSSLDAKKQRSVRVTQSLLGA
jgi:uncharacterized membrane protein YphA (DoxX/SURF4 family)